MRSPNNRWFLILMIGVFALTLLLLRLPPSYKQPLILNLTNAHQAEPHVDIAPPSRLLPYRYWKDREERPEVYGQLSCTRLPGKDDIHYAAASWQFMRAGNATVYIYGAYWDDRFDEPLVRVLVYADVAPLPMIYCQLWYPEDNAPLTISSEATYGWRPEWGGPTTGVNEPYILTCRAWRHRPDPQTAPLAVSLVTDSCEQATNVLNVQDAPGPGELIQRRSLHASRVNASIGVCLKWLDYRSDVAAQLVEWIQLVRHFGANALYVYTVHTHPNVRKVLDYYSRRKFVDVTELTHPPHLSETHFSPGSNEFHDLRRELLPLNDCLYRATHRHALIAALDMDEIIVPVRDGTWQKLVENDAEENKEPVDALVFANYYLLDGAQKETDAPLPARMLAHMWRAREPSLPGHNVKSFHNTSTVISMHNHLPMSCKAPCRSRDVNTSIARLHHYREKCADDSPDCDALRDVVRDLTMRRWRTVINETKRILDKIGIPY